MKRLMYLMLSAAVAALLSVSCEEVAPEPGVTDDSMIELAGSHGESLEVDPSGEIITIRFTAAAQWNARVSDNSDWLELSPKEGEAGMARLKVNIQTNESGARRQADIQISCGPTVKTISLSQDAFTATFEFVESEKSVSCLGGTMAVQVSTDIEFEYESLADWIKPADTRAVRQHKVKFIVEPNNGAERTGMITFCAGETCRTFKVTQRASGTEADDWKYNQFRHRSLAMRFTATWCGYCPYMGTAFDSAKSQMAGALELVSLHGEESNYVFSGTNTLASKYRVSAFPTGVVDGRASIPNYSSSATTASIAVEVAQETQASYPVKSAIAMNSTLEGTELKVDVDLYFKEADSYRVVVLLLEDGIVGYQNGGGSNYTHNDVARLALTSMSGESVRVAEDYQKWSKSYTSTISSAWKPENLKILVYVEKTYGDQTIVKGVEGVTYGKYGDTYIDNCRVAKVGTEASLELE